MLHMRHIIFFLLILFSSKVLAVGVSSAVRETIPNVMDAGRMENRLQKKQSPQTKIIAPIQQQTPEQQKALAAAEKIRFKISRIIITGNTAFNDNELQNFFRPSLNKTISLADLQNIVHDITEKYRSEGYILSRAILPPQKIKNGVVRVQVIEGFINQVIIKGNPGKTEALLKKYGEEITKLRPLQIHTLEYYMLIANEIPGLTVSAVLSPSQKTPGGADLTLVAKQKKGSGLLSYDNYGTRFVGPQEVTVSGSLYSLLAPGDNNTVRLTQTTQGKELRFAEFVHTQPVGKKGAVVSAGTNYTRTQPGFLLAPVSLVGRNVLFFGDITYPIIRSRTHNFIIHSTANYQNVSSTILDSPFYFDRIRSLIMGGSYDREDSWQGINTIGTNVTHGFSILGARNHVNQSRPRGRNSYTKAELNASRLQNINGRFSLLIAAKSQYSFNTLLATEQFGVGGSDFGRGYDPSEIVGDRGFASKLELRMNTTPAFKFLQIIQYYAFYDAGVIWNIDHLNLTPKQSLSSTGLGARFNFMPSLNGNLFIARPLTKQQLTSVLLNQNGRQARISFQLVASF